jgi:CDP-diacylglycerol--serine O-phosphatidyltransferase
MENKKFLLPDLFTSLNLSCGVAAILLAIQGDYTFSSWMIIIAILFDGLDGKIARWVQSETPFGLYLDSLADLVSSGIAPVVLVYKLTFAQMPWFFSWCCIAYSFSGSYRLARFIVLQRGNRSNGYIGLPIPVAGMTLASCWLFCDSLSVPMNVFIATLLMAGLSILMVSTIPYAWPKLVWESAGHSIMSLFMLCAAMVMLLFTKYSLFPLIFLYILHGIGRWAVEMIKASGTFDITK